MQQNSFLSKLCLAVIVLFSAVVAQAQVEGKWYNEEKTAQIDIYKASTGKVAGKITWLKEPNDEAGKPKTDPKNPNEKLRSRARLGMVIVAGFSKKNDTYWDGGTIYDPKSGKTYSCNMNMQSDGSLKVRGFLGVSLIGKTQIWTKVP